MKNVRDYMANDEGALLMLFPSLWFLIKRTRKWKKAYQAWDNLTEFFHEEVRVHQERIDASSGNYDNNGKFLL